MTLIRPATAVATLLLATPAWTATEVSLDELLAGWGANLATARVVHETLAPGLHVMRSAGGAVIASIGDDGVLIVDDGYEQTASRLQAAIDSLGGGPVDIVVNTHAHFDHADGNRVLGPAGAHIIAHHNARTRMTEGMRLDYGSRWYRQPPHADDALPVLTFGESMTLHFNDHTIDLLHYGPGHTDGDIIAWFREANVVHVGDLYAAPWPYLDSGNGGSLSGLIAVMRRLAGAIDDETQIVSGHRPVVQRAELIDYADRLDRLYARMAAMAQANATIDEVLAASLANDLDAGEADPTLLITLAYPTVVADQ